MIRLFIILIAISTVAKSETIENQTGVHIVGGVYRQEHENTAALTISHCDGVILDGLTLIGLGSEFDGSRSGWNRTAGIHLENCRNVRIVNCRISNFAGGGLRWSSHLENATISGNIIIGVGGDNIKRGDNGNDAGIGYTGQNYSGDGRSEHVDIFNNRITGHAFGVLVTAGKDVSVFGNTIHDIPGQHGIYLDGTDQTFVSANRISRCAEIGIKLQCSKQDAINVRIEGNAIDECNYGIVASYVSNAPQWQIKQAAIRQNKIYSSSADGIYLRGFQGAVEQNDISSSGRYGLFGLGVEIDLLRNRFTAAVFESFRLHVQGGLSTVDSNAVETRARAYSAGGSLRVVNQKELYVHPTLRAVE